MDDHSDIGRVFEIGKFDITKLTCTTFTRKTCIPSLLTILVSSNSLPTDENQGRCIKALGSAVQKLQPIIKSLLQKVSEYDQEIPQSQTADQPTAP